MATVFRPQPAPAPSALAHAVSILLDRRSVRVPAEATTLPGFRAWVASDDFPDKLRVTFIGQEVYLDRSNEELETHNKVKMEIARVLLNLNRELQRGTFYGDGVLVTNVAAEVSNNPDALFVSWEAVESQRVRLVPREGAAGQFIEIEGTPDWVLEVVSAGSVQKDTQELRGAYHRAGIPEYWLIDARGEEIIFQILQRRKTGYAATPNRDGWQRSRTFGRSFRLRRERNRLGQWEYTLDVRPE